jgi:hypothetical protein
MLSADNDLTINDFPIIYDADIHDLFSLQSQGILCCTSIISKIILQKLILDDINESTGFLL